MASERGRGQTEGLVLRGCGPTQRCLSLIHICYGLRADFKGDLFPGSQELLATADIIEEIKTICWCGRKATYNTRFDENGVVLKEGEQVLLGANDKYIGLCRKHWKEGNLGPGWKRP